MLQIAELTVYPIKSCRGTSVRSSQVEPRGLIHDRLFMLVDWQGQFLTQREYPKLALVQPTIAGDSIALSAPGLSDISFTPQTTASAANEKLEVTIWDDNCQAIDQGRTVAEWFTEYLSLPCRLVRFAEEHPRRVDPRYAVTPADRVSFSDGFPLLVTTRASLHELNQRIGGHLAMDRFRPNIVIDGCEAYTEDGWPAIRVGELEIRLVKPCARCTITTVDQTTTERGKEPLATLARYRQHPTLGVLFGQNGIPLSSGSIAVGAEVTVPTAEAVR
ncbi:MAG: MOSC domain-containing protein [Planctomycetes bacterium]|nr:MOSC domain-containing protein [Planctomycetota bacterium]